MLKSTKSWLIIFIIPVKESHDVWNEIIGRVVDAINAEKGYVGGQLGWQGGKAFEGDGGENALAIALQGWDVLFGWG